MTQYRAAKYRIRYEGYKPTAEVTVSGPLNPKNSLPSIHFSVKLDNPDKPTQEITREINNRKIHLVGELEKML